MKNPKVSVVTPVYNSIIFLKTCMDSILSQTYNNIEHVIIDNNSTDGTSELVEEYKKKYHNIIHLRSPDHGIYDAMNKGIEISTGEWLLFLGSDDTLHSKNIIQEVFLLDIHEKFDFIYGNVMWGETETIFNGEFSELKLMYQNIPHQAIFYHKSIFEKIGNYNINYKVWADWELNIRCFKNRDIRFRYIEKIISNYRLGGFSSKLNEDDQFLKDKNLIYNSNFSIESINLLNEKDSYVKEYNKVSNILRILSGNIVVKIILYIYIKLKLIKI